MHKKITDNCMIDQNVCYLIIIRYSLFQRFFVSVIPMRCQKSRKCIVIILIFIKTESNYYYYLTFFFTEFVAFRWHSVDKVPTTYLSCLRDTEKDNCSEHVSCWNFCVKKGNIKTKWMRLSCNNN